MNAHTFSCIVVGSIPPRQAAKGTRLCELICSSLQFRLYQYVKDLVDNVKNKYLKYILYIMSIVENNGFEPLTSCMPCKRSSQLS